MLPYRISFVYRLDNIILYRLSAKSHIGAPLQVIYSHSLFHCVSHALVTLVLVCNHLPYTLTSNGLHDSNIETAKCHYDNTERVYHAYCTYSYTKQFQ